MHNLEMTSNSFLKLKLKVKVLTVSLNLNQNQSIKYLDFQSISVENIQHHIILYYISLYFSV